LNSVITVGVLNKADTVVTKHLSYLFPFLFALNLTDDFLDYTESVLIHRKVDQVLIHWVENELDSFLLDAEQYFLEDMSTVLIEGEVNNMVSDAFSQLFFFLWHVNHFYKALH
jgi:hypothetical protein